MRASNIAGAAVLAVAAVVAVMMPREVPGIAEEMRAKRSPSLSPEVAECAVRSAPLVVNGSRPDAGIAALSLYVGDWCRSPAFRDADAGPLPGLYVGECGWREYERIALAARYDGVPGEVVVRRWDAGLVVTVLSPSVVVYGADGG